MADIAADTVDPIRVDAFARLIEGIDGEGRDRRQIDLLKFVIDRVGLAVLRAMTTGSTATIEAPDAETARLLRLALAETAESRPTDRLVTVTAESSVGRDGTLS